MNTDPSVILTIAGIIIGITYCVVEIVGDIRVKRYAHAAWGIVTGLVLIQMAWIVHWLAG
ncbi:MAG: hypothetical protein H0W65_09125 [Sphingomonas sp.]|uniref:hypothetical protein n=1 Tax=Sphingomonas sp. TaxID=28214 RepID=UPI00183FB4E0|nr:hypothetical protein [Sphingomonas sp.]MBA3667870.1 hypothetical protein [Sphingomonas sp.]